MKKIFILMMMVCMAGIIISAPVYAAQTVDFNIRFFDKRIYYTDTDPVYIQISIINSGTVSYRFKLADERAFSIDFDIRTVTNRPLDQADALIRKRTQYQQVFFREVTVEPGETFSFMEDLRDYVNLKQPGSFLVQAKVYPELYRSISANEKTERDNSILVSNRLNLNIRPPVIYGTDGIPVEMDTATGAVLVREKKSPDQVVEYMLIARQKSQWEKFFLYLDLEAMLSRDSYRKRQYLAESEAGRRKMLAIYRQELQSIKIDNDISTIPTDFIIERTNYNNSNGTVIVLQKFRADSGNFTELKRFTYDLIQSDGIWIVVNYSVINLGTE
jgi:hypothetical protein